MSGYVRTPHQHTVKGTSERRDAKGWAVVTLFGGLSHVVELTRRFDENESRSFSLFFNADSQETFNPIVLFSEQEIIGRVLSHDTAFEQVDAIDDQWYPIVERYCKENGIDISRIPPAPAVPSANTGRSV